MNNDDPKLLVARGYDKIGGTYGRMATRSRTLQRNRYETVVLDRLPEGSKVLDLGCGSGVPTTRRLARRFDVTGVDISEKQVERARLNVPNATFVHSDMAALDFAAESFDGVTAYYSIIHLPRDEQGPLLSAIVGWLRPGGLLVCSLGTHSNEVDFDRSWMGAPMFWSGFDSDTNRKMVEESGFRIIRAREETTSSARDAETFLWIIAERSADRGAAS